MTALARLLAQTFMAARWPHGVVCARCHDGNDVGEGPPSHRPRAPRGLSAYRCRCCKYEFTDTAGTEYHRTSAPLFIWAYFVLGGDPQAIAPLPRARSNALYKLARMARRVAEYRESALNQRWRAGLGRAGITREQLLPAVKGWALNGAAPCQRTTPLARRTVG